MAIRRGKWTLFVDIVGGCNLRCSSCPVGNSSGKGTPRGMMAPERLDRICAKAVQEFHNPTVYLFNWAEPFPHPRLDEMIRVVKRHGLAVEPSANLNIARNFDKALAAEPRTLRVSVSGFEQDNDGRTHKRGDIERVKANMAGLADLKKQIGSRTKLTMLFHRYLDNHPDEAKMKAYAEALGYEFSAVWAYLMPAEKLVALGQGGLGGARLSDEGREVIGRFALDPLEANDIAKKHRTSPAVCSIARSRSPTPAASCCVARPMTRRNSRSATSSRRRARHGSSVANGTITAANAWNRAGMSISITMRPSSTAPRSRACKSIIPGSTRAASSNRRKRGSNASFARRAG